MQESHPLKYLAPSWPALVMGTGGLGNILWKWHSKLPALQYPAILLAAIALAAYFIIMIAQLRRFTSYPAYALRDLHDSVNSNFYVTTGVSTIIVATNVANIWSIWLPISKPLWTGSYVLYAGGWAILCLAFFIWFIDVKGKQKFFTPFRAMGMNPLFAFVMAGVLTKTLGRVIHWTTADGKTYNCLGWFYRNCGVSIFGDNEYASLMFALCYVALFLGMAMILYRKKIIIKL